MTDAEIRDAVFRVLRRIAPEIDPAMLDPKTSLREQIDLDSIDFLNFVIGLDTELHVEVPETDYAQLATLEACMGYLRPRATGA